MECHSRCNSFTFKIWVCVAAVHYSISRVRNGSHLEKWKEDPLRIVARAESVFNSFINMKGDRHRSWDMQSFRTVKKKLHFFKFRINEDFTSLQENGDSFLLENQVSSLICKVLKYDISIFINSGLSPCSVPESFLLQPQ